MLEVKSFQNPQMALIEAASSLNSALTTNTGKSILLLLSGGSALSILENIDSAVLTPDITITVLDERYSGDANINNFAQVAATEFYKKAKAAGCQFINTQIQNNETQEELANRFNSALLIWVEENPEGMIIATVGMGPDGHTSGIMPYPESPKLFKEMFESERLVVAYDAGDKNEYRKRVTTTITFMRKINTAICYIVGENKKNLLSRLINENGPMPAMPARILKEINSTIFTDQEV